MIKDYKNFLYEQKDETRNIGKRVRIRNDSEYRDQAYENGGNGEGYIVDYRIDDEYGGLPYEIIWDGGREDSYARIDFDFIEEDEIVEPTKIKWFNKGKLDESLKDDIEIGDVCKYLGYVGNYYETMVEIIGKEIYKGISLPRYSIKFHDGKKVNGIHRNDICLVKKKETNQNTYIKWFNKGKLDERYIREQNEEEPKESDLGRKVKMKDDSEYYDQAYKLHGIGTGEIINVYFGHTHVYRIKWDISGFEDFYRRSDIDFIESSEPVETTKIKWFNKGKLDESDAVDDFFHEINKYEFGDMDKCPRCNSIRIEIDHDRNEGHCINPHCGWDWIIKNEPVIKWYKHGELK